MTLKIIVSGDIVSSVCMLTSLSNIMLSNCVSLSMRSSVRSLRNPAFVVAFWQLLVDDSFAFKLHYIQVFSEYIATPPPLLSPSQLCVMMS